MVLGSDYIDSVRFRKAINRAVERGVQNRRCGQCGDLVKVETE